LAEYQSNSNLIELLNKGDIVAFDAIYAQYCQRLFGFVLRYLKNKEDAEEIIQEVFLKIWENRLKINSFSSFDSFIFTIAYNATITLLRKRIIEQRYLEKLRLVQQTHDSSGLTDEIQFFELNEKVNAVINRLTPRQQEIFRLSRGEGLTHKEIAEKLNISTITVKNHLVTALAFLRSELHDDSVIMIFFLYFFAYF